MKRILVSLALCVCASDITHGADNSGLYNEIFAQKENAGLNFTPVPRPAPGTDQTAYNTMRSNYTQIAKQNHNLFRRGGYTTLGGTSVKMDKLGINDSINASQKLKGGFIPQANDPKNNPQKKPRLNKVTIKDQDTYEAAIELQKLGGKVAILNFANKDSVGGGYLRGANAQEEDLCRRSTLYPILDALKNKGMYPIAHDELIYTPKVKIIRTSYKEGFKFLDQPYMCDVITQAAYNLAGGEKQPDPYDDFNMASMVNKIRDQFRAAAQNGCGSIVVGAFGCGAFGNDPVEVSKIYLKVLQEPEFQNVFNEVRFAILGQKNLSIFTNGLKPLGNRLTIL